jgi:hypothetical protein
MRFPRGFDLDRMKFGAHAHIGAALWEDPIG